MIFILAFGALPSANAASGFLDALAEPQEGRSMRETSTMRQGEVRRGGAERVLDPRAAPKGDSEEASNWDNFRVPAGETHVLMDAEGPGVITHIGLTFLGPEPQGWAPQGSANHQEMLLRMFWDGQDRPAVEAPVGDVFANCIGRRSEVVSLPVIVEDRDSYNCYWRMPFRRSARVEIVNQSEKPIGLLYDNIDEREDDYASVAYWYQTDSSTFSARAPHARERALPSLERVIAYARDFTAEEHHGIGLAVTQQLDLHPGPQLLYRATGVEGAWLEIPFTVEKKEPLRLLLNATQSYDFGRYQAFLDGKQIGDVLDLYSANIVDREFHLLDFWPEPSVHELRLECVGKDPLSEGFYCGLESVRLRERRPRVAEMGHDRDKDWREELRLYR